MSTILLKNLTSHEGQTLTWATPALLKRAYELHAQGDLVGTLRFRSLLGTFATAESAAGSWTFKRTGFFATRITVRAPDSDRDLAVFRPTTWSGGGTLEFADGRKFHATTKLWSKRYEFRTEQDELVFAFKENWWGTTADIAVTAAGWRTPELPILLALSWYLVAMAQADGSAAAVSAA